MPRFVHATFVLAVVGIVPAFAQSNKSAVALSEMQTLANAMAIVEIDTGYFTTLENLDDLPSVTSVNDFDYINDMGGALALRPTRGDFDNNPRVDFLNLPATFGWLGPYVTVQSSRIEDAAGDYDEGSPLDPWGNPYYFYSPVGLIDPKVENVTLRFYGDEFADYRIVSHGPDGLFNTGDDLTRFVAFVNVSAGQISSTRIVLNSGKGAEPYEVRVKGFRFGNPGTLTVDGIALSPSSWTDQLVTAPIAFIPGPSADTELITALNNTLTFEQVIDETPTASVEGWELYN